MLDAKDIYDVLIIGSGAAGLRASIEAKSHSSKVAIISKTKITSCGSVQAQGGINAVVDNIECSTLCDSVEQHIQDTIKAGKTTKTEAVKLMCQNAPKSIKFLEDIGVPFDKDENGNFIKRQMGGSSSARTLHCSDYTGLKIVNSLYEKAINDDIEFIEYYKVLDLIIKDNICHGVIVLDIKTSKVQIIKSKSLIIASGGYASIYDGYTTNANSNIGDMISISAKQNIKISNMDKIQFHPTSLKNSKLLMSEGARAEGGYLINSDNERFVDELLPRDIVSKAVFEQIQNGKNVYIDVRHFGVEKINNLIPQERHLCYEFEGVDIVNELVQITPSAHYTMGGISVDLECRTSVSNVFACGECADIGVHGDNRLGGNSLLDGVVFGQIAGANASKIALDIDEIESDFDDILKFHQKYIQNLFELTPSKNFYDTKKEIGKMLFEKFGIIRNEANTKELKEYIKSIKDDIKSYGIEDDNRTLNTNLVEYLEFVNMIEVAELL